MRIVVDGYELAPQATGVGRVIKNILPPLADQLADARFFILTREVAVSFSRRSLHQVILRSRGGYFRWQNGPFWRSCHQLDPDVILAPNYTLPMICPWPSILFVHDISLLAHPEWFSRKTSFFRGYYLRKSIRRSELVVVPSRATEKEIISRLKIKKEKIRIIYYGVEDKFAPAEPGAVRRWKQARGCEERRVIGFLGALFRRRNIPLLVSAAKKLREEIPDLLLYVVGENRTHPPENLASLLNQDWIRWERFLPEAELPLFYSACDAFAYLSEYEGFGLPPLEALSCGSIPVVFNRSSLGEVFADLAIMVEHGSIEEVVKGLRQALLDEGKRAEIRHRFAARRKEFSWEQAGAKLADMIRELGEKRNGKIFNLRQEH